MTSPSVTITECDLQAYVDDQLDLSRRFVVETHLSRHPDQAAQVMAETWKAHPRDARHQRDAARRLIA